MDRSSQIKDHQPRTQDRESPQVGTHGSSPRHDGTTTADTGQDQQGQRQKQGQMQGDPLEREMARGGQTKEPHPSGTTPLERDQRPINQQR